MKGRLRWCSKSHIGLKRRKNEDHLLVAQGSGHGCPWGCLFAVADGMGGHPGGEIASRLACEVLEEEFFRVPWHRRLPLLGRRPPPPEELLNRLRAAFQEANRRVCEGGPCTPDQRGMGTTLSALALEPPMAVLAHVGDSRIYLFRRGRLSQLTRDHTFINELIESGDITREQARRNPLRHVLEQAIGQGFEEVFTATLEMETGDRFLLCTDGLHDMVTDGEMETIVGESPGPEPLCDRLVEAALEAGGRDNVTVIVVEWKE